MSEKIKVSVVSYLNSQPFIYGLEHTAISNEIILYKDIPSVCAQRLIDNEVDKALHTISLSQLLK